MQNIGLVASSIDKASINILEHIRRIANLPYAVTDCELPYADAIDRKIDADFLIFLSRHESASKLPALLVHAPGNWAKATHGGRDKHLCRTSPQMIRQLILLLKESARGRFQVLQECSHHGPDIDKPCLFVEIGSSEAEWNDSTAGSIIAGAVSKLDLKGTAKNTSSAIGLGGPHYAPKFNSLLSTAAFGHICPKHMLPHLDKEMLLQAMDKSQAQIAYLDWKGLGPEKARILHLLETSHIEYKK